MRLSLVRAKPGQPFKGTMIIQLSPSIPLDTPKGPGEAVLCIDYSKEDDLMWVVILDRNGEIWTFNNKSVRGCKNISLGRELSILEPVDPLNPIKIKLRGKNETRGLKPKPKKPKKNNRRAT